VTPPREFQASLSFEGFEAELAMEIARLGGKLFSQNERLFLHSPLSRSPVWAQTVWLEPRWLEFESASEAAKLLKELGPLWANYSFQLHRRSELIQEKIHRFQPKPLEFLGALPTRPFGAWTLWEEKKILASARTNSVFALGEARIAESAEPPSRAYQKLFEVFTVHGIKIARGSHVLDMGCAPGGWTWVLSELGLDVTAVDKAPLAPELSKRKNIQYIKKDAFTFKPADIEAVDVFFSDIICDPVKLFELVEKWRAAGVERFVCTLKFKGDTDFAIMDRFAEIPGSRLVHLFANKHEVTWIRGF